MENFELKILEKSASSEITRQGYSLNKVGIRDWLISKNLMLSTDDFLGYSDLTAWSRTGGETYCTSFEFTISQGRKQIIIKALVTMFPEKSLLDWTKRRNILAENDIQVSNWYFTSEATIYEDFYPFTSKEKIKFETLLSIGHKLDSLGFATLKFIDDIRADENGNPYFIDFGFDLGEPSKEKSTSAKEYLARIFPDKASEIESFYNNED